tara:strand:+ start:823 stop:1788 length:966 start_codon:yes stop_codon:yes gene_type:complete
MSKRIFRIEAGRYGGETVIGEVDAEFVDYFLAIDKSERQEAIIEHVTSYDWDDGQPDADAPIPKEDYYMWECDDIEHINSAYADSGFFVTEVTNEEGKYDYSEIETPLEAVQQLYGREAYSMGTLPDDEDIQDDDNYVPTLAFHSGEKGGFGCWFVETDGEPFDKYKFTYGIVETDMGEFIDSVWYDKKELETDYDYNDTTGKGYYAGVGYMNTKWHDKGEKYIEGCKSLEMYWEDFDDTVEYEKKEASTTVPLDISVDEIAGEVGTIDNPGFEVDPDAVPLVTPPIVEDNEAETYKDFQNQLTQLNADGNPGIGEDGEKL